MTPDRAGQERSGHRPPGRNRVAERMKFIQGSGSSTFGPGGVYYVRVAPDAIVVRDVRRRREIGDVPQAAVDAAGRVVAVGREAGEQPLLAAGSAAIRSPFARSTLAGEDVDAAVAILKHLVRGLRRVTWLPVMIRGMIVHPDFAFADPLTTEERDAFLAMARGAGARTVHVWEGRALTDDEVFEAFAPPAYRL